MDEIIFQLYHNVSLIKEAEICFEWWNLSTKYSPFVPQTFDLIKLVQADNYNQVLYSCFLKVKCLTYWFVQSQHTQVLLLVFVIVYTWGSFIQICYKHFLVWHTVQIPSASRTSGAIWSGRSENLRFSKTVDLLLYRKI